LIKASTFSQLGEEDVFAVWRKDSLRVKEKLLSMRWENTWCIVNFDGSSECVCPVGKL